jgi:thymidylate synthase
VPQVVKVLEELGIDLSVEGSRIAVVANLYGNGLPQMLRNLLWNPQIRHVVVLGQNLSGSREELVNFFARGLEQTDYLGSPAHRIRSTSRIIDGEVGPEHFGGRVSVTALGKTSEPATREGLVTFFRELPPPSPVSAERVDVPIPRTEVTRFPSEPRNHNILRNRPLEAWQELVFRLVRFGQRSRLKKGERVELQNVKVIVEAPEEEAPEMLERYGFSLTKFQEYQRRILDPEKPPEIEYTYGNRMRGHFRYADRPVDSLEIAVGRLGDDPESRHVYVALWDNARDLSEGHGCPCLVSLFFRRFDDRLTLTATFRSHNTMDAWLENFYGLMAIQRYVAERVGIPPGAITVFSHSISISPDALDRAKPIARAKRTDDWIDPVTGKREPRYDYHGNFTVTVDLESRELVVHHSYQGMTLTEYRGRSAEELEDQLARDCALSEISHALYLGRELARKEALLKKKHT